MPDFNALGLKSDLLKAIEALGFKEPMPIQEAVIPVLIENPTDLVGLAQTGTGKTAAFGLPVLHHIDAGLKQTQALILCPTRELCLQITKDLNSFSTFLPDMRITAIYGGASIDGQIKELNKNPQIIVATPGRLQDMMRRGKVDFSDLRWVVLDEADEMLDMGFQEDVETILAAMPAERNILLFSATMPAEVERILNRYMKKPVIKSMGQRNSGTANVRHSYYLVHAKDRYSALKRLVDFHPAIYAIVFCRTRVETQEVADMLMKDGYNAAALHGDLSQSQRDHVMGHFRQGSLQLLVATDVAARGLDVNNLTHVINYSLPDEAETYVHRSGRTGRADKNGLCVSLVNMRERGKIRMIEKQLAQPIPKAKVPTGRQVCEKQLFNYIDRLEKVEVNHEEIDAFMPIVFKKLEFMEREELLKRFVSLAFNRFLDYYRDAADLNVDESSSSPRDRYKERDRDRGDRDGGREDRGRNPRRGAREHNDEGFQKMFISLGRKDSVNPGSLIGIINQITRSRDVRIGRIKLMDSYSFVDIDERAIDMVQQAFGNKKMNPDGIRIETVNEQSGGGGRDFKRDRDSGGGRKERKKKYEKEPRKDKGKRKPKKG